MNDSAAARANKPTMLATIPGGYSPFFIQPSTDWAQFAISRFIYHYVEPPSMHGLPGYLEFLPTMLNSADTSLQTSLLAASLASLANVSGNEQLRTESRIQYGRALRSLHAALSNKATVAEDHTLLAIVLLQKYEVGVSQSRYDHANGTRPSPATSICARIHMRKPLPRSCVSDARITRPSPTGQAAYRDLY
jgi:hypothetical protein